jgi:signal transduction histidine kinase
MLFLAPAPLINLPVFAIGAALYAMLLLMVIRHPVRTFTGSHEIASKFSLDWLLLATSVLGLVWNLGGLFEWLSVDLLEIKRNPFLIAIAYSALGFLPAVVVHSVFPKASGERETQPELKTRLLTISAYGLSGIASVLHFYDVLFSNFAPSFQALQSLTFGYLIILAALLALSLRQSIGRKAIWATALAVFAVSALHLSQPHVHENSWVIEIAGHQASLPLALAILYQDFRFAFADLFLKRALSLLLVTASAGGFYWFIIARLFSENAVFVGRDAKFIAVNLFLWIVIALVYPQIRRFSEWLVNKVILRRVSYEQLQTEIMQSISKAETVSSVLENVCGELKTSLTASEARWQKYADANLQVHHPVINPKSNGVEIVDQPAYKIVLDNFKGGRRLLSDEIEMLGDVAVQTARRIDVLRVTHERCEQELREQEFSKLATEAQLSALRAQINPHFLFNALTTISYLIDAAPEKANQTLMRLTKLLRGVLRSTDEFLSLGEEIALIESYLEIERARFEERLMVETEIAPELLTLRVPSLILQPLVENAVKHGISPKKSGGTIRLTAAKHADNLVLEVSDTGTGVSDAELAQKRGQRIGLNNVEERLRLYFNDAASLTVNSRPGKGTTVTIEIELDRLSPVLSRQKIAA